MTQALIKTGGVELEDDEKGRGATRIINMSPDSNPRKLIGYDDVQEAFREVANDCGFRPVAFDELWLEHRYFISNRLLQSESVFYHLIIEEELFDPV